MLMSDCNQATVSKIQPTGYPGFVQRGSNLNSWEVITKTFIIVGSHHILWQFLAFRDAVSGSVFISSKCGKAVGSHGACMVLKKVKCGQGQGQGGYTKTSCKTLSKFANLHETYKSVMTIIR